MEPSHLDIALTARSLILQREKWRINMIGEKFHSPSLSNFSDAQKQEMAGWQKEQEHVKTIAEERAAKAIEQLPEPERQPAKEKVLKILTGEHDPNLRNLENNEPVWSKLVSSPLGQELGQQARMQAETGGPKLPVEDRSGTMTITYQPKDPSAQKPKDGLSAHKEAVERDLRENFNAPSVQRGKDRD